MAKEKKPKIVEDINIEKKKKEHSALKTFLLVILIGGACFFIGAYYQDIFESFSVAPIKDSSKDDEGEEIVDNCIQLEQDQTQIEEADTIEKALTRYYYFTMLDKEITKPEDIDLNDLLLFVSSMNMQEVTRAHNGYDFSLKQANKILKKYFDYEIEEGADILCELCGEKPYLYDKENKVFTYNWDAEHGHGGSGVDVKQRIISAKTNDDNENRMVTVLVKQAFGLGEHVVTEYYDSIEDAEKEVNPILKMEYDEEGMFFDEYDFNNVSNDKMNTYEYVFEIIDGIYVLKSYKKL